MSTHGKNIFRFGDPSNRHKFKPLIDERVTGTVRWFFPDRFYGFITRDDNRDDVFVHGSYVDRPNKILEILERVEFNLAIRPKGIIAYNVTSISGRRDVSPAKSSRNRVPSVIRASSTAPSQRPSSTSSSYSSTAPSSSASSSQLSTRSSSLASNAGVGHSITTDDPASEPDFLTRQLAAYLLAMAEDNKTATSSTTTANTDAGSVKPSSSGKTSSTTKNQAGIKSSSRWDQEVKPSSSTQSSLSAISSSSVASEALKTNISSSAKAANTVKSAASSVPQQCTQSSSEICSSAERCVTQKVLPDSSISAKTKESRGEGGMVKVETNKMATVSRSAATALTGTSSAKSSSSSSESSSMVTANVRPSSSASSSESGSVKASSKSSSTTTTQAKVPTSTPIPTPTSQSSNASGLVTTTVSSLQPIGSSNSVAFKATTTNNSSLAESAQTSKSAATSASEHSFQPSHVASSTAQSSASSVETTIVLKLVPISNTSDQTTFLTAMSSLAPELANSSAQPGGDLAKTSQPSSSESTSKAKTAKSHSVGVSTQISSSSNLSEVKRPVPASTALPVAPTGAEGTSSNSTKPSGSSKRPSRFGPPLSSTLAPAAHEKDLSAVAHSLATTSNQPSVQPTTSKPSMQRATDTESRKSTTAAFASSKTKIPSAPDSRPSSAHAVPAQSSASSSSSSSNALVGSSTGLVHPFVSDTVTPKPIPPSASGTASTMTVVATNSNGATDDSGSSTSKASLRSAPLKASVLSSTSSKNSTAVPTFTIKLEATTASASAPKPAEQAIMTRSKAKSIKQESDVFSMKEVEKAFNKSIREAESTKRKKTEPAVVIKSEPIDQDDDIIEIDGPNCKLCVDEPATITFLPCNHTVCCLDCSIRMKRCIRCNHKIDRKIKQGGVEVHVPEKAGGFLDLMDKVNAQEEAHICVICMDKKKSIVFNCGHLACADCAKVIERCHLCQKRIVLRTRIFEF